MFLLVTGASGMGKSTARLRVKEEFEGALVAGDLIELGGQPEWSLRWRHQAVEKAVLRALELQAVGKHFLLASDPVPPGEVLAAPSASELDGLAVCLLDASEEEQRARLTARGDDADLLPQHVAFADWMRRHLIDPSHMPQVVTDGGWDQMRWDRWLGSSDSCGLWSSHAIDTSGLTPDQVAAQVVDWIRSQLSTGS